MIATAAKLSIGNILDVEGIIKRIIWTYTRRLSGYSSEMNNGPFDLLPHLNSNGSYSDQRVYNVSGLSNDSNSELMQSKRKSVEIITFNHRRYSTFD